MVMLGCVHSRHVKQSWERQSVWLTFQLQPLEVARQVGIGLFMFWIDHLIRDDYASNPLLNDLHIDFDDEPSV